MQSISTSSSKALHFMSDQVQKKLGSLRPASGVGRGADCELAVRNDDRHKYRGNSKRRLSCAGTVLSVQVIHHDLTNDTNSPYPPEIDLGVSCRRSSLAQRLRARARVPPSPCCKEKNCQAQLQERLAMAAGNIPLPRTPWPSGDTELASVAGRGAGC